jgi:G3E family GTPase
VIPLSVIGGFLGAGKTTLVNHLLRAATRRYGVLVNDFGAVNVDAALIAGQSGQTMALTNGCVCCSLGEDFGAAVASLAARDPAPEHIIVEASGVSDPWRIAQLALIEPGFELMPLVVMVDATAIAGQLADPWTGDTVRRQLAFAELVVLTKHDLAADPGQARAIVAELRPQARLITAHHGDVPQAALTFAPPPRPRPSRFQADIPHLFPTWRWPCPMPLDRDRLRAVLGDLPPAVLRVKGLCLLGENGEPHVLQYAAERWAFSATAAKLAPELVIIGTPELTDPTARFDAAVIGGRLGSARKAGRGPDPQRGTRPFEPPDLLNPQT